MPKNFYTLLILPKKHSSAKKINLSSTLIKGVSLFVMGFVLFMIYFAYDYIHIRWEQAELKRLKVHTAEQRKQIDGLMTKVDQFSSKMEELKQFDKKIRILANIVTGRDKEQLLGIGGPVGEESRIRARIADDERALIAGADRKVDNLMDEAIARQKSFANLLALLKEKKSIMAATPSLWPVGGWVTSEFGRRLSPFGGEREFHKGIDIATRYGQAVQAPADGVVAEVAYSNDGGRMISIDHGHGITTHYAHLFKASVRPGAAVKKGERIGHVGNTGRSTGSHLHYSVMLNGVAVNPRKYLN
ncbi:MAG: M23 family metallopeptidase [Proteobacteria bacterium]|nr:M23 family metallopeptidase [Pseudomonadota bacterium]MBU2226354.1 M23 family metallopeptidase [Pseudomonadota bacterium]MBU2260902.1 M23 family metallopeptidase [Pseudomonadota bacterium]